jgi:hypothetical protein
MSTRKFWSSSMFFQNGECDPRPLHQRDASDLYLDCIQQKAGKSMHKTTRSRHTTPTNPIMGEDHAIRALCPKSTNHTLPSMYRGIIESPYGEPEHTSIPADPQPAPHAHVLEASPPSNH